MKHDLHCHSFYSDGDLSPAEVIQLADQQSITHLALTDHDTVDGLAEAHKAAENSSITLINGIELSCTWEQRLIHIVGLNIDPKEKTLLAVIKENKQRRLLRAEAMYEDFEQNGIDIRLAVQSKIPKNGVPTRPHFAEALIELGLAKDKKQAFKRYLVKGKTGYVPMRWPDLAQIGPAITAGGGVAVLAHPTRYKLTRTKLSWLIKDMVAAGVKGMEICTASTDKQQIAMLTDLAEKFNLFGSTGSDFHSEHQPWAKLGRFEPLPKTLTPVWNTFK
ncbi:PHP domain-containing protein [Arenicella sp. 4NH20-0111]|uniref:PHP domain-containing protein n=1 Tax=Arenicella sp. 4NH20-0111 TaxID=3127648 RepID=UPI003106DD67